MIAADVGVRTALLLTAAAAWFDVRQRRVPNYLTLPGILLGLLLGALRHGARGFMESMFAALVGFGILLFPSLLMGAGSPAIGGGDLKLTAAVGALTGIRCVLSTALAAAVCGGMVGGFMLMKRGRFLQVLTKAALWITGIAGGAPHRIEFDEGASVPFAPCILAGLVWTLIQGGWL